MACTRAINADALGFPAVIAATLVDVVESVHEPTRPQVAVLVRAVLAHPSVQAAEEDALLLLLVELHETARIHFAEASLAAMAERSDGLVASFDRDLARIDRITQVEP